MKSKYFKLKELVSEQVYRKYGEMCWDFFDPRLIKTIDFLKEHYGWTITINNYLWGGEFQQRGLRCNFDSIVKNKTMENELYLSAHVRGQAVDFDVKGKSAKDVRMILIKEQESLPFNIRLEMNVNWVHLDVVDRDKKIYLF